LNRLRRPRRRRGRLPRQRLRSSGCRDGDSAEVPAHELLHDLGAAPPEARHACPDSPDILHCRATSSIRISTRPVARHGHARRQPRRLLRTARTQVGGRRWSGVTSSETRARSTRGPDAGDGHLRACAVVLSVHVRGKARHELTAGRRLREIVQTRLQARNPHPLTPSPAAGRRFGGWSGGCAGRRACSVGGEGADVVARFVRR
jgi:hypothetical protein